MAEALVRRRIVGVACLQPFQERSVQAVGVPTADDDRTASTTTRPRAATGPIFLQSEVTADQGRPGSVRDMVDAASHMAADEVDEQRKRAVLSPGRRDQSKHPLPYALLPEGTRPRPHPGARRASSPSKQDSDARVHPRAIAITRHCRQIGAHTRGMLPTMPANTP